MNKKAEISIGIILAIIIGFAALLIVFITFVPDLFETHEQIIGIAKECTEDRDVSDYITDVQRAMKDPFNDIELAIAIDSQFRACNKEGRFSYEDANSYKTQAEPLVEQAYFKFISQLIQDQAFDEAKAMIKQYKKFFGKNAKYSSIFDDYVGIGQNIEDIPSQTSGSQADLNNFLDNVKEYKKLADVFYKNNDAENMLAQYIQALKEAQSTFLSCTGFGDDLTTLTCNTIGIVTTDAEALNKARAAVNDLQEVAAKNYQSLETKGKLTDPAKELYIEFNQRYRLIIFGKV